MCHHPRLRCAGGCLCRAGRLADCDDPHSGIQPRRSSIDVGSTPTAPLRGRCHPQTATPVIARCSAPRFPTTSSSASWRTSTPTALRQRPCIGTTTRSWRRARHGSARAAARRRRCTRGWRRAELALTNPYLRDSRCRRPRHSAAARCLTGTPITGVAPDVSEPAARHSSHATDVLGVRSTHRAGVRRTGARLLGTRASARAAEAERRAAFLAPRLRPWQAGMEVVATHRDRQCARSQGATTENIGKYSREEQRSEVDAVPVECRHHFQPGLLG